MPQSNEIENSETRYLIAHKVRGRLAFDIAVKLDQGTTTDPGPWWIIETSGHRAYPYWMVNLNQLTVEPRYPSIRSPLDAVPSLPDGLRDHFEVKSSPKNEMQSIKTLELDLEELGL